jgi:hypothetical protein
VPKPLEKPRKTAGKIALTSSSTQRGECEPVV